MKVAITGGTGFVGRHFARLLTSQGHDVVLISRGVDRRDTSVRDLPRTTFHAASIDDAKALSEAFAGCDAIAHCSGINREIGEQTYERVHVQGTRNVIAAARTAGIRRVAMISFLRARPNCGIAYHESKFAAEELLRASELDYTILKCGVIYGRGDHMLDHLSHAFHTFPLFALVGFHDNGVAPMAVEDVARILAAILIDGRLSRQTIAVTGPDNMPLGEAVARVAAVVGKRPFTFRAPVMFHSMMAWIAERVMTVPLVAQAQVRMLAEGIIEALPPTPHITGVAPDLAPTTRFTADSIARGLPPAEGFGVRDCRCWNALRKCRSAAAAICC